MIYAEVIIDANLYELARVDLTDFTIEGNISDKLYQDFKV